MNKITILFIVLFIVTMVLVLGWWFALQENEQKTRSFSLPQASSEEITNAIPVGEFIMQGAPERFGGKTVIAKGRLKSKSECLGEKPPDCIYTLMFWSDKPEGFEFVYAPFTMKITIESLKRGEEYIIRGKYSAGGPTGIFVTDIKRF